MSNSDSVLRILAFDLEQFGFNVEVGKKKNEKLSMPVLYGEKGLIDKAFLRSIQSIGTLTRFVVTRYVSRPTYHPNSTEGRALAVKQCVENKKFTLRH